MFVCASHAAWGGASGASHQYPSARVGGCMAGQQWKEKGSKTSSAGVAGTKKRALSPCLARHWRARCWWAAVCCPVAPAPRPVPRMAARLWKRPGDRAAGVHVYDAGAGGAWSPAWRKGACAHPQERRPLGMPGRAAKRGQLHGIAIWWVDRGTVHNCSAGHAYFSPFGPREDAPRRTSSAARTR
jgi:hypothetical protein